MDPFILIVWYFIINCVLFIFESGFVYGLLISEVFLFFCLRTMDHIAIPLGAIAVYLIIWLIVVSCVYSFLVAILILLAYALVFVLPVYLWFRFH